MKDGDIVFILKKSKLKSKLVVSDLGILVKRQGGNMILLYTKTGFRLKQLHSFNMFYWFPTKSIWTAKSDALMNTLKTSAADTWKNKWAYWFHREDSNKALLTLLHISLINVFDKYSMSYTTTNLFAYALNTSLPFYIVTTQYDK